MKRRRMYLKATGSQCYDRTGVIYPGKIPIDLEIIFNQIAFDVKWEFDWDNQLEVLCFDASDHTMMMLDQFGPFLSWLHLAPCEHWMYNNTEETLVLIGLRLCQILVEDANWYDDVRGWLIPDNVLIDLGEDLAHGRLFDFIADFDINELCEKINTGQWKPEARHE